MNSESNNTSRFKGAEWFGYPTDIILGGAGGIGSWVALLLGRLNYRTFLYDMDVIESHNIGTQFYKKSQQDKQLKKATTVSYNITEFGGSNVIAFPEEYTLESMTSRLMVSAFDNMKARKLFYGKWKDEILKGSNPEIPTMFVDGRMSAESGQVYFVHKKMDLALYESTLFDDSELEDLPCSYKSTPHNGSFIASLMVTGIVNKIYNTVKKGNIREIPFKVSFELPSFDIYTQSSEDFKSNPDGVR